jgi:hypothetical protein
MIANFPDQRFTLRTRIQVIRQHPRAWPRHCNLNLRAVWTPRFRGPLLASETAPPVPKPDAVLGPKRWRTYGAWGSSIVGLNMAALLQDMKSRLCWRSTTSAKLDGS